MILRRSAWMVSACATVLWAAVATSAWAEPVPVPATRIAARPAGVIQVATSRATPVAGDRAGALPEALAVGAAGLFALGMGTVRLLWPSQEW
jgi:hypothetical protein